MPEAVIVDAVRTPIGRAVKGSLKDVRADDLAAVPLKALVERNPEVDFDETDDLMMGCGFQAGEQGYNIGRNAWLLAGIDHHVPATTVNRFCASSLQTIRMAFHAIMAGEGDQYIAAGVEAVSRFGADNFQFHPQLDGSEGALYNVYIPMGITAENVAERCKRLARVPGRVGRHLAAARRRRPRLGPLRPRDRRRAARPTARSPRTTARAPARRSRSSPSSSRRSSPTAPSPPATPAR